MAAARLGRRCPLGPDPDAAARSAAGARRRGRPGSRRPPRSSTPNARTLLPAVDGHAPPRPVAWQWSRRRNGRSRHWSPRRRRSGWRRSTRERRDDRSAGDVPAPARRAGPTAILAGAGDPAGADERGALAELTALVAAVAARRPELAGRAGRRDGGRRGRLRRPRRPRLGRAPAGARRPGPGLPGRRCATC